MREDKYAVSNNNNHKQHIKKQRRSTSHSGYDHGKVKTASRQCQQQQQQQEEAEVVMTNQQRFLQKWSELEIMPQQLLM